MENGSAVVKPLVTRTSDGIEDDTFVKRLEEGAPVAEEGVSGTEKKCLWYGGGRLWCRGERPAV